MSITIYDIAREANVSIATVSRVFSNSKQVSEKTRQRVVDIANRLGYRPQATAQNLASRKKNTVAVIVPVISNYFFIEILAGIQDQLNEYHFDLNIINISSQKNLFEQVEGVLQKRYAEGYIFVSIHLAQDEWSKLQKYNASMILIDDFYKDFDSVSVDNITGAYQAVSYFLQKGANKVAMLSALSSSKPIKERLKGYYKAFEDYGVEVDEELIYTANLTYRDGFTEQSGYECMLELLHEGKDIDGCFCTSDAQAFGALKAMDEFGKRVPIIGFDDIKISEYIGLSSMRQPIYQMGSLAMEKLIDKMKNSAIKPTHTVFKPELVIRKSSEV